MTEELSTNTDKKPEVEETFLAKRYRNLQRMAPDIVEVFFETLKSPFSGAELMAKRIVEKMEFDAAIQKNAEEDYQEKVKTFKNEFTLILDTDDKLKTINYLLNEVSNLAENAIRIDNQELMNEVFAFYKRSSVKLLIPSELSKKVLANIKTDLGLIRLKVMWADSQRTASLKQKIESENIVKDQLRKLSLKERGLQLWVFFFLIAYIVSISLAIYFGAKTWSTNASIPWLGIPIGIVFWSAIGSLANMLYKYYKNKNSPDMDRELRWVWTRPIVGIIMGTVTYLVVASGLILIGAASPENTSLQIKPEILWLFAFLGSFSDKIFEGVIEKAGLIAVSEKYDDDKLKSFIELMASPNTTDTSKK